MCCVVRGNSCGPIFADNRLTHWCFCVFSVVACSCHPVGSAVLPFSSVTFCDPSNGDCPCKPGVAGPHCERCMVGYWGFGDYGCRPCDCAGSCDPHTGDCLSRWTSMALALISVSFTFFWRSDGDLENLTCHWRSKDVVSHLFKEFLSNCRIKEIVLARF